MLYYHEQELYHICPERLQQALKALSPSKRAGIEEIRLRCGYAAAIARNGHEEPLSVGLRPLIVTPELLSQLLDKATGHSTYAAAEYLKQGFVTVAGGHRIGFCGQAVLEHGQIRTLRALSSANIRVAKQVDAYQTALQQMFSSLPTSTLIIGPPGAGKTTLLRELTRLLSDRYRQRVSLIDERFEVAACRGGSSLFSVGCCTDILSGCPKAEGMERMLRTMGPQWLVVDEITAAADIRAMERAAYCGVHLVATAHAANLRELQSRPLYRTLLRTGIFRTLLILDVHRTVRRTELSCTN